MSFKRKSRNPKRSLHSAVAQLDLDHLAERVRYGGSPQHKRNPGDFGLVPPADPRQDKTLCDEVNIFSREEAQRLLSLGVRRGLVSRQLRNGWPQNVWVVADGVPMEAELENEVLGSYHGYPMLADDPFRDEVLRAWEAT